MKDWNSNNSNNSFLIPRKIEISRNSFFLDQNCLSTMTRPSKWKKKKKRTKKKERKKKKRKRIRSNPSAHLPVIKTYNSRQPSAKPCPRPLSYLSSSSLLPSPLAPRQSASSFSSSPYASHRMPSCIFHTLYRNYFIALPWISASHEGEEGRGEYLSSCQHRGPNTVFRIFESRGRSERGWNFDPFFSLFFHADGNRWKCEKRLFFSSLFSLYLKMKCEKFLLMISLFLFNI